MGAEASTEANTNPQIIKLNVDSGAARTACQLSVGTDYPITAIPSGTLRHAGGDKVSDNGDKELMLRMNNGSGPLRILRTASAGVSKNLLSVSELVDQDYDVHFSRRNRSVIRHNVTGKEIPMTRDGKLWDIFAQVVPFEESRNLIPRTRGTQG
eukprot:5039811-Karenia_brevis.AAC.1